MLKYYLHCRSLSYFSKSPSPLKVTTFFLIQQIRFAYFWTILYEITQYAIFCEWCLLFINIFVRFNYYLIAHSFSSTVCHCMKVFIHFAVDSLGCFQYGAIIVSTARNILIRVYYWMDAHIPTECTHTGELWGHRVADGFKQTSKAILKLDTPKSSIWEFPQSHTLVRALCCPSLNFNQSHGYVAVSHCNINLYFPDSCNDTERCFIFISHLDIFLCDVCSRFLLIFVSVFLDSV